MKTNILYYANLFIIILGKRVFYAKYLVFSTLTGGGYSGSRVFIDKDVKEIPQYDEGYLLNLKKFPYYYVKPLEGKIYVVRNEKDFFNAIKK